MFNELFCGENCRLVKIVIIHSHNYEMNEINEKEEQNKLKPKENEPSLDRPPKITFHDECFHRKTLSFRRK